MPLSGAIAAGLTASWPMVFPLRQEAKCTALALDSARPRQLIFYHTGRKLAGTVTVRGDEKKTVAVRLAPVGSVRGRVVDVDGLPMAGVTVATWYSDDPASELARYLRQGREAVRTDREGRFLLDGVVPDLKFGLSLTQGRTFLVGEPRIGSRQVAPGKVLDLGDLRVKPGN
jgi:hypothetical protein